MRRMSVQRRRVVVLACSVAAMSGVGPVLFSRHAWLRDAWIGLMLGLLAWVVVLTVRLRRDDGCA